MDEEPLTQTPRLPLIEICVEGIDGLLAAQSAGADRVELCASLVEGGITPSFGTVRAALDQATVPFHVMVRPRGGDFLYSETEYRSMLADVAALRDLGVGGVVFGCLSADGTIDEQRMSELTKAAGPLSVTCHRAFDMTRNPTEALEALIRCKVGRVLTSGQRDTAVEGAALLADLVRHAGDRIVILGCGALDAGNIAEIRRTTGLSEMHFAALKEVPSAMRYRNPGVGMGASDLDREYRHTLTDAAAVAATIAAARHDAANQFRSMESMMTALSPISRVSANDEATILALNNEHAAELSWLEAERLSFLLGEAFYARRIGHLEAFIMTFDQDARYDSPNFLWFRERYKRFVYVDRVVVAADARGRGHARRLYQDLFDHVGLVGQVLVTCEVNIDPPNPASDAFHAALGFTEIGEAIIHGGKKAVRYYMKSLQT
jgi:copper homeostasis protein